MGQSTAGERLEVWSSSEGRVKNTSKEGRGMDEQSEDIDRSSSAHVIGIIYGRK